jgi:UDPglucose 6-dehydrogenase
VSIIEQVERVNHERKLAMAIRVEEAVGGSVRNKTIAVLGLTFKPNTDDMRDAPSLVIVPMLQERGATIRACDPQGRRQAEPLLPGVVWCESANEAAEGADALVVVTEWNEFRALDLEAIKARMKGKTIVDLRNVFDADVARELGLSYSGIGRGNAQISRLEQRARAPQAPIRSAAAK